MPTSKIKTVAPIMDGDEQSSFQNKHGQTNYKYEIVFEDGTAGEVNSTKEGTYTYSVGQEVEYKSSENEHALHGTRIYGVKKIKEGNYEYT